MLVELVAQFHYLFIDAIKYVYTIILCYNSVFVKSTVVKFS